MPSPLPTYGTRDEVNFLVDMYENNRPAFRNYAAIVKGDMREFDPLVNRHLVKQAIEQLETTGRVENNRFRNSKAEAA